MGIENQLALEKMNKANKGKLCLVNNIPCLIIQLFPDHGGGIWMDLCPLRTSKSLQIKRGTLIQIPFKEKKEWPGWIGYYFMKLMRRL